MDITMFFTFPGILITIGAVLLLLSIILLIMAFKTNDTSVVISEKNNKDNSLKTNNKKENIDLNNNTSYEKVVDEEKQLNKNAKDEKSTEDGFDLTKVFEISGDKGLIEKDISPKNEQNEPTVAATTNNKTIEQKTKNSNDEDEEIELL